MQYYPIIDKRQSCEPIVKQIAKNQNPITFVESIQQADAILVGGGDGFMLNTMRKNRNHKKVFVGYHCGTLGFLMNKLDSIQDLPRKKESLKTICTHLINIELLDENHKKHQSYCINDITIGNSVLDYLIVKIQTQDRTHEIRGTGLVVSTSIGATGYALNLGAPLMPLESTLWSIAGIATRPFHYKYIKPQTISIELESKRPIQVGCDGHGDVFKHIKKIILKPSKEKVTLGFCPNQDFISKRVMLAEEKLGSSR